jgi:hypothetical protein
MSTLTRGKWNVEKGTFVTPKARLAFAALHEPKEDFNGEPKYQATLLFDELKVNLELMKRVAWETLKAKNPKADFDFNTLFRDGDEKVDLDGFSGMTYVATKANVGFAPAVYDQKVRVVAPDEIPGVASGDYVLGILRPYAWTYKAKVGVSFGLVGVQLVEHGTRFAGGKVAVDDLLEQLPITVDEIDSDEIDL